MGMEQCYTTEEEASGNTDSDIVVALLPQTATQGVAESITQCTINPDSTSELICYGYQRSYWKSILAGLSVLCSGGFLLLIFYWRPDWKLRCTHSRTTIMKASQVLLRTTDETNQVFVSKIKEIPLELANLISIRYASPHLADLQPCTDNEALVDYGTETSSGSAVICFKHHSLKYIWNKTLATFIELGGLDKQATLEQIHQDSTNGLQPEDKDNRLKLFGPNVITVKIPAYLQLLLFEILNPFYVFQLFAVIFWVLDEYVIYASAIFVMSVISAVTSLIEVRRERFKLHQMVEFHNEMKVQVLRQINEDPQVTEIWSKDLVPGDVLVVPPSGMQLACDAALVSGTCIVNESMLTGESVPVTKTPLPSGENELKDIYDTTPHKRHTLFCGTEVLQTRFYRGELVKAVVVRTGYHTAKGKLVHSILYPKPVDMKLLRDAYRFVGLLFTIAMAGFVYTVVIMANDGESVRDIFFSAVDLITISVPPALPLAMTIGIIYAQLRLKKQKIHCISPQRINISGQVDVVAFDKTGTMTEDGLDLSHIIPSLLKTSPTSYMQSDDPVTIDPATPETGTPTFHLVIDPENLTIELNPQDELLQCMVTCHTLTTIDGKVMGDPLDLKMFEATKWSIVEPSVEDESKYDQLQITYFRPPVEKVDDTLVESIDLQSGQSPPRGSSSHDIGIVRQFPFASTLQRASVIVRAYRAKPKEMKVYLKGAPEMVASLCAPSSVPNDFHQVLKSYTQQGFRMIGMACKDISLTWLKAQKIERRAVECDLKFLGLIALQNKLKPQSKGALEKLDTANIRSVMVTGDNLLTALSVAHESGMIRPSEDVLLATTTEATENLPATLKWKYAENTGRSRSCSRSSFSSSDERISKKDHSVSLCMGEQMAPKWHLAVSGKDFETIQNYFPEWIEVLSVKGTVFARMSPDQKTELMANLQSVDHHVCMCGDGANDCGALKRAHTGISLSEHEASVAAPFTSHTDLGIECVPTLIREGRAALVTSFGMFKFMALYSLIQFCTITILYSESSNLSDLMYLYIDLIIIDVVAVTMSRNHACKFLHNKHPPYSLVSLEMLVSLLGHIILQLGFQVLIYFYVRQQCWYTTLTPGQAHNATLNITNCPQLGNVVDQSDVVDDFNVLTYEASALFYFSSFLYMSTSLAFSRGFPFRTPIYKNYLFIFSLLVLLGFTLFMIFGAPISFDNFVMVRRIPDPIFLLIMVGIAGGHFIVAVFFEMILIERSAVWDWIRGSTFAKWGRRAPPKRFKVLRGYFQTGETPMEIGVINPMSSVGLTFTSTIKYDAKIDYCKKTRL
ncbi:polyamine-transporting ATPase 13A3 [Ciona intestinalis]